jgi:uncharacterized RDD family membrane protein YckC
LAALGYEALLVAALFVVVGFVTVPLTSPSAAGLGAALPIPDLPARALSFAVVFAAGALYCGWSWTGGRRTLPMKTWRLALIRRDGSAVDRRVALVRYLAAWIGPAVAVVAYLALRRTGHGAQALWFLAVNYLWALIDGDRRFLHDRIAGTRIVDDRS